MNGIPDFLGLPNIRTTKVEYGDKTISVEAESIEPVYRCCLIPRFGKWGNREDRRIINDTPHGGLPVAIHLKARRGQCYECGKRGLTERFDYILEPRRHMTKRLASFIAKQTVLVGNTNSETGRHIYVSEATARRIANQFIDRKIDKLERPTPRVLGIDEKRISRVFRAVLGNIEERTVLNMLPDRAESLEEYLTNIPDQHKIEVICIDQYEPYLIMTKKLLPGRAIVTDRFHVVRKANESLDHIRSGLAASLRAEDKKTAARLRMSKKLFYCRSRDLDKEPDWKKAVVRWEQRFPILSKAYWTKERFFDMYEECDSPGQAEAYYKRWKWTLDPDVEKHFSKLANIQPKWLPHVFAYFEHPFTTGYVESVNRGLKAMQAEGRRMKFETIRGKLMLAEKLEKKTFRDRFPGYRADVGDLPAILDHNWGIDVGLMNNLLSSKVEHLKLIDGRYRTVSHEAGFSTIRVDWDEAA